MNKSAHLPSPPLRAPVAQRSEQGTHNSLVVGSSPAGSTKKLPPLPDCLKQRWGDVVPLRVKTYTAGILLEYWGFTENGPAYVKKLVRCGTLTNVMRPGLDWRFDTLQVLALWQSEQRQDLTTG